MGFPTHLLTYSPTHLAHSHTIHLLLTYSTPLLTYSPVGVSRLYFV